MCVNGQTSNWIEEEGWAETGNKTHSSGNLWNIRVLYPIGEALKVIGVKSQDNTGKVTQLIQFRPTGNL